MADRSEVYSDLLSSYVGKFKDAQGNSELRAEILAKVKSEILQHASEGSVALPQNLRVFIWAIRRHFLPKLDPNDQDDEGNIIQHILAVAEKKKEESGEGEDAREERARPVKAGDYRKAFTEFTAGQQLFKEDMDANDRERRDTKDPKTIGQRTKIIQQWWESVSEEKKAEAGRAAVIFKLECLILTLQIHRYWRKNFLSMAREFMDTVQRTMGCHIVMFAAHQTTDSQIKMFETQLPDGNKVFSQSSEATKDWVVKGEDMLSEYLVKEPVEPDCNEEKQEVEIALDDEGNPLVPPLTGQKLKVQ
ncbi:hypothetical protein M404DRAFT_31412 [Pisolithus tinctorius Marx 270]|uniref:Uncharacterized protein n=1 Tax=Pisolithus tinctorius Marx 270 TaxID=870435 RepID=A0A0C3JLG8_PISTI|nr:hypothetical protein M404DRAFT_31412 [Pisolithus tinctorius Marx 270]